MTAFARGVLWIAAALFLGFGVWLLIDPAGMAQMGLTLGTPTPLWRIELRAFYGGLEIGLAAFLALCARRPAWTLPGLWAAALILGATGGARLLAMGLDGFERGMIIAMASELGGAALALAGAVVESRAVSGDPR